MDNKTYLVDTETKRSSNLSTSLFNSRKINSNLIVLDRHRNQEEQLLFKKKMQFKLRLNKMRKRTKLMLKNHNWKKYFSDDNKLAESNSLSLDDINESFSFDEEFHLTSADQSSSIFTDSSFVSTYDIVKVNNNNNQDQQSKLNLFNYFHNNKTPQSPPPLPNFSCSFSTSIPFSTSEMFQVISNCSSTSLAPTQKEKMNFVNTVITSATPVSIRQKCQRFSLAQTNICSSLFKTTKQVNQQQHLNSSSFLLQKEHEEPVNKLNKPQCLKFSPIVKLDKLTTEAPRLRRQPQSLTFIADLASTSTPTRISQQPIASTPKMSCHDPLKYHPTHTIRNKAKKGQHQPFKVSIKKKTITNKLHCQLQISRIDTVKSFNSNTNSKKIKSTATHNAIESRKRKAFASELNLDCLKYTAQQHMIQLEKKYNQKNIQLALNYKQEFNARKRKCAEVKNQQAKIAKNQHRFPKRKPSSNQSFISSFSSINSCENCDLCILNDVKTNIRVNKNVNKKKKVHQPPSLSKIKFKAANFEISLGDLLYAPSKIRSLDTISAASAVAVKSATAIANADSNPSKVYYL